MNRIREYIDEHLNQVLIGLISVIVIFIIIIGVMTFHRQSTATLDGQNGFANSISSSESSSTSVASTEEDSRSPEPSSSTANQQMYVDVKGAVKNPGVYQINANMRVVDAINLAGGYNHSADRKHINLAQKLSDQQVVYVPIRGEVKGNPVTSTNPGPQASAASSASESQTGDSQDVTTASSGNEQQINLNTADKTKLQELNGIGEKKADQIIAYRQAHGQFKRIEELKDVPGFGDKTFDNLKSSICV